MSNPVDIQFRRFENLNDDLTPDGTANYGFVIYDNEGTTYNNNFNSKEELQGELDKREGTFPQKVIDLVCYFGDNMAQGMLDFVQENEKGITINGTFYEWDEIKACFD
jgi:hypothetical protein